MTQCMQRMSWNIPISSMKINGALLLGDKLYFPIFLFCEERNYGIWCYQTGGWIILGQ